MRTPRKTLPPIRPAASARGPPARSWRPGWRKCCRSPPRMSRANSLSGRSAAELRGDPAVEDAHPLAVERFLLVAEQVRPLPAPSTQQTRDAPAVGRSTSLASSDRRRPGTCGFFHRWQHAESVEIRSTEEDVVGSEVGRLQPQFLELGEHQAVDFIANNELRGIRYWPVGQEDNSQGGHLREVSARGARFRRGSRESLRRWV